MSERAWNVLAWASTAICLPFLTAVWLPLAAAGIYVVLAAVADIWDSSHFGGNVWEKIALLLIFVRVSLSARRIRKLDHKIEQLRITAFATASYLNFEYGNELLDPLKSAGHFSNDHLSAVGFALLARVTRRMTY